MAMKITPNEEPNFPRDYILISTSVFHLTIHIFVEFKTIEKYKRLVGYEPLAPKTSQSMWGSEADAVNCKCE